MECDDVSLLVPEGRNPPEYTEKIKAAEIKRSMMGIAISQIVCGVALIAGGIGIAASWPFGVDNAQQGIWCGVFVVICGSLSLAASFYLDIALVITCLVVNILTSLLLTAGTIMAAVSTISDIFSNYRGLGLGVGFICLNLGLICCLVHSIYISVVYGKIIAHRSQGCCPCLPQNSGHHYSMVYVPPEMRNPNSVIQGGAYVAAPMARAQQAAM